MTPKYKFGDKTYAVLGKIETKISITDCYFFKVRARVVDVEAPLLLGLDVLDNLKVLLNFGTIQCHPESFFFKGEWAGVRGVGGRNVIFRD